MLEAIIVAILIGVVADWLAGLIMKGGGFGFIWNAILGIIGGLVGTWLLGLVGVNWSGILGAIGTSVIGAVVILFIAGLLKK